MEGLESPLSTEDTLAELAHVSVVGDHISEQFQYSHPLNKAY